MSSRERCSVIATSRPSSSSGIAGVDALGGAALDHRVDGRVELDRELAHDRLLVQQLDAVERRERRRARRRCAGAAARRARRARGGRASSGRSTPASALSACAVQMLCVAFSRRMCCSRVCSVSTKPRRPSTSRRLAGDAARHAAQVGLLGGEEAERRAAEVEPVAERLPLPHGDVDAELAGRLEHAERQRVAQRRSSARRPRGRRR